MMMKKLKLLKLAFLGGVFLSLGIAQAQDIPVQLSGTTTATGYAGETVRVPVNLDTDVSAENILAIRLELTFSNMTPVAVTTADGIIASWTTEHNILTDRLVVSAAGTEAIAQTGALFYIDFQLSEVNNATNAHYGLYSGTEANYFNEGGFSISMASAYVHIELRPKLSVYASNSLITKGESTTINVSGGTEPYTYTVTETDLAEITSGGSLLGNAHGMVHVLVEDSEGVQGTTTVEVRGYKLGFALPEVTVYRGEVVDVAISTTDLTGLNVLSGAFTAYLPQHVSLQEVVSTGTLLEGASIEHAEVTTSQPEHRFAFANSSIVEGEGALLVLRVLIEEQASSSISFSFKDGIVFNEDLKGNYANSAALTITPLPTPTISTPQSLPPVILPGTEITFEASGGTPPYVWSLSKPEVGSISSEGLLVVSKSGDPKVIVEDANGKKAESTQLQVYDGVVKIENVTVPFNTEYNVPILVTELPVTSGYSAFDMRIDMDASRLEFLDVINAGTLSESFSLVVNDSNPAQIRVVAAGTNKITAAGTLFYLKVRLKEAFTSGSTSLSMTNVIFNEGFPVLKVENGNIAVGDPPPVAGNTTITLDEDGTYTFASTDFSYSQSQSKPFASVRIESLPVVGVLKYGGNAVYASQVISVNDLGQLQYIPDADKFGASLTSFTVKVSDADKISDNTGTVSVNVNAVNDAPVFTLSKSSVTVLRNFTTTETVDIVLGTAPFGETSETYSYSMEPSEVAFANVAIDPVTGTVTITSKADQSGSATITVTANDGQANNNTASQTFTLEVSIPNEAPVISDQTFTVAENRAASTVVGTVVATDANNDALTYSITAGNTANAFSINANGELVVATASALDFEVTPSFALTVEVSDGSLTATATVTVNLNDVDETVNQAPQISAQSFSVDENKANGSVVGTVAASDPDGNTLTWSITAGNTNNAFAIDAGTGQITVANSTSLDYETVTSFSLTIEVSDGSLTASANVTVSLNNVDESTNQAPQISNQSFTIAENRINGTAVGTVNASDADKDALAFSITAGNNNGVFVIDANTGQITVNSSSGLDFETVTSFSLTVSVTDGIASATATVTITVTDVDETVNQAPQIISQSFTIAENNPNGTSVGTVTASDPDGDALTFTIASGNSNNAFAINATTGEITVNNSTALDFETVTAFNLTVEVSDGSLSASGSVTINIADVNETLNQAPLITAQAFSIAENSVAGTVVAIVSASDPDGDPLAFSITAGNTGNAFAINTNTGQLTVANGSALDFESTPSFSLAVQATDGNLSASATVTINIMDVDEEITGVEEDALTKVSVYPLPAHGRLNVTVSNQKIGQIRLIDVGGRYLKTLSLNGSNSEAAEVNIGGVKAGIYLLEVHTDKSVLTRRIIIE